MRQGLLVIAFVAYSLLAVAQAPMPEPQLLFPPTPEQQKAMELDKIMVDLGIFKGALQEIFLPVLPVLKERYKAHYKQDFPQHLESFYPIYMGIRNPYVNNLPNRSAELGFPPPTTHISRFFSGNLGFVMGMADQSAGGLIPELQNINCAGERVNKCFGFATGELTEASIKAHYEKQNTCFLSVADEIQNVRENVTGTDVSNPECANLIRTDVRNFRKALEDGKYGLATKPMDPAATPNVGGGVRPAAGSRGGV